MASTANSGKTNREIVTDWYTRYAEEIAGYENTLANLNIQLTQAQQDGDTARADGLQGQIADYTNRENIAKGQCSIPELGLQGFDAVSQTYNKIEQYREALEQAQQSYQNSATSASRSVDNAETKLAQSQREDDTLTNLQTALENCTLTATMDGTITALDATVGAVCSGTVATIQDVDNLTVEVTIPASSVGRLKTGLQCNITSDATDDTVTRYPDPYRPCRQRQRQLRRYRHGQRAGQRSAGRHFRQGRDRHQHQGQRLYRPARRRGHQRRRQHLRAAQDRRRGRRYDL